jgi:3-keto-5-aminohexanoate cleavage enzyme
METIVDKLIITVATTGAVTSRKEHPKLPLHPEEMDATWSVIGIGKGHLPLATMAIHMGGHVRVGFEDNVMYRKNQPAASNTEFVTRIVLAEEFERPVATVEEARKILHLTPHTQS